MAMGDGEGGGRAGVCRAACWCCATSVGPAVRRVRLPLLRDCQPCRTWQAAVLGWSLCRGECAALRWLGML